MSELSMVVCAKVVPKPEEIRVDTQTGWLKRENVRSEINPPDMNAMEMALRLKDRYGGRLYIISMGPPFFVEYLRVPLSMGGDHIYLLSDPAFAGADTLATTYTLSQGIRKIGGVDLVFCGEESSDGATGQVPPGIAEWMECSQLTILSDLDVNLKNRTAQGRREIKGGYEIIEVPLPAVISVKTASNEPRFMDYTIKSWAFDNDQVSVWGVNELDVNGSLIGEQGSPTTVSKLIQAPEKSRNKIFIQGSTEEIVDQLSSLLKGGT